MMFIRIDGSANKHGHELNYINTDQITKIDMIDDAMTGPNLIITLSDGGKWEVNYGESVRTIVQLAGQRSEDVFPGFARYMLDDYKDKVIREHAETIGLAYLEEATP